MRIAIEATLAQGQPTGLGNYSINLLEALARLSNPEDDYLLLYSTKSWNGPDLGRNFHPVSYRLTGKQSLDIIFNLNRVLRRERAEIFHATCTTGIPPNPAIPCVATIHDLYPLIAPEECSIATVLAFRTLVGFTVRNAKHFILNSAFTGSELKRLCGIPEEMTSITHLASCLAMSPVEKRSGDPFILCVGAIEGRKGQLLLANAYKHALLKAGKLPPLRFVGPDRGDGAALRKFINQELPLNASWDDFVTTEKLIELYQTAALLACPSFYEGFGIPIVEAECVRLPVICSDLPVFREVNGDWPVYAAPSVEGLASALSDFSMGAFDDHFKKATPPSFSWDEVARKTFECYKKALP